MSRRSRCRSTARLSTPRRGRGCFRSCRRFRHRPPAGPHRSGWTSATTSDISPPSPLAGEGWGGGKKRRVAPCATIPREKREGEVMGVMERFFGRRKHDDPESAPVVNTALQNPPSLQVLFAEPFQLDPAALTQTLQSYHPSLSEATFELDPGLTEKGTPLGLVGWGEHVVQVVGFDVPMPEQVLELCVQPAHYGAE